MHVGLEQPYIRFKFLIYAVYGGAHEVCKESGETICLRFAAAVGAWRVNFLRHEAEPAAQDCCQSFRSQPASSAWTSPKRTHNRSQKAAVADWEPATSPQDEL